MGLRKITYNRIQITHVFLFYWIALVAWQNLGSIALRSGFDLILKVGLILILTAFYFWRARSISKNIVPILLLAFSMILSLWLSGDAFSGSNLIAYIYPVLLAFLSFGIGDDFRINKREFLGFLNGVILVTLYASIYAVLFRTEQFLTAFSLKFAYGNELTSFFYSSHEYGMYLVYAIVACIVHIEVKRDLPFKKRLPYFAAILVFVPNLVLTFSRTSMLAMAVIIFVYCFANARIKLRKWLITAVVIVLIAVLVSDRLQNLLVLALFKGTGSLGGRNELFGLAIKLFSEGTMSEKLFGYGLGVRDVFERYADHGSVHNAYLQVLMYFGAVGLIFFLVLLFGQLYASIRLYRESKFYSLIFCILLLAAMALMFTNTAIVFTSPIDSYFLTVIAILVPKYARNAMKAGTFET